MYQIINAETGAEIGKTDKPRYIKQSTDDCLIETIEKDAQGVAYDSTPYNLQGRDGVGAEVTVLLRECDAGEIAKASEEELSAAKAELTNTQLALCTIYEQMLGAEG